MEEKNKQKHRPVVLIICDGWGVAVPSRGNAITEARTPHFDSYVARYPTTTLQASGEAAGLPWGEVGNSEVGHMSIGAGRIVYQELSRINYAITSGEFFSNPVFLQALEQVKNNNSTLHLIGMLSPGGVHSHSDHLFALLELALKDTAAFPICIHLFLDGRDTPYASGFGFVERLCERIEGTRARIASVSGRFYAMDRDNHWERIEQAYRAIAEGVSEETFPDALSAIKLSYEKKIFDEEVIPTVIASADSPYAGIAKGDAVLFFNFRADRARQLTHAMTDPSFASFKRKPTEDIFFATLTSYENSLSVSVAFEPQMISHSLAEVISAANLRQLHIAETEKYAHMTYFLNDGREEPFKNEERVMIPSPSVPSYDSKPEMSAKEIAKRAVAAISAATYDFIAINFANADMVGHTGNREATIKAVQTIDECFGEIVPRVLEKNGAVLITADHGNAEVLVDLATGAIDKEHSSNPVPCIIITNELEGTSLCPSDVNSKDLSVIEPNGILSDVAPTLLFLLGLSQPPEMTGKNILEL